MRGSLGCTVCCPSVARGLNPQTRAGRDYLKISQLIVPYTYSGESFNEMSAGGKMVGYQLRACGRRNLPVSISVAGKVYHQEKVFKHDFFAATGLYSSNGVVAMDRGESSREADPGPAVPKKVVLKMARQSDFLGLPLGWLGGLIRDHEQGILARLQGLAGVPRLVASYGRWGLIYEYIKGQSLDAKPDLPDDYFDRLVDLLGKIHQRGIAYVDMNKRGNLLLGADQRPYLIDYQIAWFGNWSWWPIHRLSHSMLAVMQREDLYHLFKHKRRLRQDLMSEIQIRDSRRASHWIVAHRMMTRPLIRRRRELLAYLYRKGKLVMEDVTETFSETDPRRWEK